MCPIPLEAFDTLSQLGLQVEDKTGVQMYKVQPLDSTGLHEEVRGMKDW
jgi:hypothetical protein